MAITHTANASEQPAKVKMHPTQRLDHATKGRYQRSAYMHTRMKALIPLALGVVLGLSCLPDSAFAQGPLRDRIMEAVDTSRVAVVPGNMHPMAHRELDQGKVDPSMRMRVTVTFKMTAAQQADLDSLLAGQQQRGSPDYQRWLTPEQFGSRFGLSQGDINKVTQWLESEGFRVESVPASRNMIAFSGTAQQVESALHTEIHHYVADGKTHFANASEPSVPVALSDVIMGFRGLNNFELKPRMLNQMNMKFTSSVSGKHYITPADFATIYDVKQLYQQGVTGAGQKIVVVGQSDVALSDIRAFRSNSGLPANDPTPIDPNDSALVGLIVPGDADPKMQQGDIDEANLDVEWAGAIAYNATIVFIVGDPINGGGVMDAINYAITTSPIPAPVISTSYGGCEPNFPASVVSALQSLMKQANAEGITVLAPTGDTGAADCDFNGSPTGPPTTASTQGLAVDLPGALQTVTAVGGTEFNEGNGTYWKAAVGTDVISSAISYIPEQAWDDTNAVIPGTSTSVGLSAGGGGASTTIPKPAWQAGTGVPNDGARDVPDVSFNSSLLHDGYLICDEKFDSNTKTFAPTCVSPFGFRNSAGGNLAVVGGTSVGPPVMASIVALINQFTNHPGGSGNINPVLYPLAAHLPTSFHDVTTGNNQVPFSPPCVPSTQIGYTARTGYDLATGLGSIDAFVLVTNWTSVSPASTGNASTSVDFSLAFTSTQVTVKRGTCGSGTLRLTRLNGFDGTPGFTCTVPATLGTTTCAVVPVAAAAFDVPRNYRELGWWGVTVLLFAASAVAVLFRRTEGERGKSRAWSSLAPGLALVTMLAVMIGCGGSSKSSSDPTVNYTLAVQVPATAPVASAAVNVSAAIGGISHTAQITVSTQ
jgi:subtilase family serine protease